MKESRNRKKLPVGVDNFEKLIRENFYYVDKTNMIADLLRSWGEVNLFTRPRRFGKSLNMGMLKAFFEIGCDATLFEGLAIAKEQELCDRYMGKFPVISISLKNVEGLDFESACAALSGVIGNEALRFSFLRESTVLTGDEKKLYERLTTVGEKNAVRFDMSFDVLTAGIQTLSALLAKHYGRQVILLIDEYDVPLDKAFQNGYYDKMVSLIRGMFGNALKTNPNLYFAVLIGCLRVSKESIFTGLNNMKVLSIADVRFDEYFGFTHEEVEEMLRYYGFLDHRDLVQKWYNGYQFGNVSVYCPWDVISYCDLLCADPNALPQDFWSNTSGNSIVRRFIDKANAQTRDEMERLISGETIRKEIHQDLTYNELDKTIDHLWSVLFMTGYLTQRGREGEDIYCLTIPNYEIKKLFQKQIREWFKQNVEKDRHTLLTFCNAFPAQNPEKIEELLNSYLWNTISIRDTAGREKKENFYHGLLLGLLRYKENWLVLSNAESGEGYSDILVEVPESRIGIVIEMKYAEDGKLDAACETAMRQIWDRQYGARLKQDGMKEIVNYAIACYRKQARVVCDRE